MKNKNARYEAAVDTADAISKVLTLQMNAAADRFLETGDRYWLGKDEALNLALKTIADLRAALGNKKSAATGRQQ